jgi:hypothetical protein
VQPIVALIYDTRGPDRATLTQCRGFRPVCHFDTNQMLLPETSAAHFKPMPRARARARARARGLKCPKSDNDLRSFSIQAHLRSVTARDIGQNQLVHDKYYEYMVGHFYYPGCSRGSVGSGEMRKR